MGIEPSEILVAVITVSDRSAAGEREDRSGPMAVERLHEAGFTRTETAVIPDGADNVSDAIATALRDGADLVVTTGGTGVGPRDRTPEGTRPHLDLELPGIAEAIRAFGATKVPTAITSRGFAGLATPAGRNPALIVNLAGSTGAVMDGLEVLLPVVPHLLHHARGGDHE